MKKYGIGQGIAGRYVGKINKKGNERLDKEALSDDDVMQLFESMGRYIAEKCKTPAGNFTVIKTKGGKETIGFKILDNQPTDTEQSE